MTFDLRTPNSNLTCISSNYTSKIFKIRPTFLKLLCGNQFEYIMSCDLWPADSKFELTCILVSSTYTSKIFKILPTFLKLLCGNQFEYMSCDLWPLTCGLWIRTWPVFHCHLPTHQKYSKSVHHFWSYCAETNLNIWAVTFDLWPADSEFELDLYFSVIYLHIKNIQNPSNIFEVIVRKPIWIYNELWPLTCGLRIRTWPVFWCHLPTYRKYPKSVQDFWSYCAETNCYVIWYLIFFQRWLPRVQIVCDTIGYVAYIKRRCCSDPKMSLISSKKVKYSTDLTHKFHKARAGIVSTASCALVCMQCMHAVRSRRRTAG